MNTTDDQPVPPLLDYMARGGTIKDLRNIDQSQLDAMYQVAFARCNSGQFTEALPVFRHLCLLDHTSYAYFLGLGISLYELGDYALAAAALAHGEKLDERDPRASLMQARCFVELEQWHLAHQALSEVMLRGNTDWQDECDQAQRLLLKVDSKLRRPAD